jgi:hypothetical protein
LDHEHGGFGRKLVAVSGAIGSPTVRCFSRSVGRETQATPLIDATVKEALERARDTRCRPGNGHAHCCPTALDALGAARAGQRASRGSVVPRLRSRRVHRGGRPAPATPSTRQTPSSGSRRSRAAVHRLCASGRGALASAAERSQGHRATSRRSDRPAQRHSRPRRARPRPSAVRRMAASSAGASTRATGSSPQRTDVALRV